MQTKVQLFKERVPDQLCRAILRCVFDGCASAFAQAKEYEEFRFDALPEFRRLKVETILSGIRLPPGFKSEVRKTPSSSYTLIWSQQVALTAVTRTRVVKSVPPHYRGLLVAQGVPEPKQLHLFKDNTSRPVGLPPQLYGLLIYGGSHGGMFPTQAKIVFPGADGQIPEESFDLLRAYPDVVSTFMPPDIVTAPLKLRRKKEEQ